MKDAFKLHYVEYLRFCGQDLLWSKFQFVQYFWFMTELAKPIN